MELPHAPLDFLALIRWAGKQTLDRLFRPFQLEVWLRLGFCAWLSDLGRSGLGYTQFGGTKGSNTTQVDASRISGWTHAATNYVSSNWTWLLPLAALAALVIVAIWIVLIWISSHGRFLFLEGLLTRRVEIARPWHEYAAEARSLFWFRIVTAIATLGIALGLALAGFLAFLALRSVAPSGGAFLMVGIAAFLLGIPLGLLGAVALVIQSEIVEPMMWLRRIPCLRAWRVSLQLLRPRPFLFIKYLLVRIVLGLLAGILLMAFALLTCCIGGILMALPYIGAVLLLPVTVFFRLITVGYLAHFGPDYDLITAGAQRSR